MIQLDILLIVRGKREGRRERDISPLQMYSSRFTFLFFFYLKRPGSYELQTFRPLVGAATLPKLQVSAGEV
jgi:hypothetical protein